ncbi:MAG: NAD(P)-dependent oxidoreductase [Pseudomonadota bacterium]
MIVTGSSGHLGEALMRFAPRLGLRPFGVDIKDGPFTDLVADINDADRLGEAMVGADGVIHTATLHKPHVATHSAQDFVQTNIAGTLSVLQVAAQADVARFVFSSTTSAFGAALAGGAGKAARWINEDVTPVPRNIYGVTKVAAEDLCELAHKTQGTGVVVLRVSRFFPEEDDNPEMRRAFSGQNAKTNEFMYRRIDIEDAAEAHCLALKRAGDIGFGRFVVSATTPFERNDCGELGVAPAAVVARRVPQLPALYERLGLKLPERFDRVYDNARAREALGWAPRWTIDRVLEQLSKGVPIGSRLAEDVGTKGYHDQVFEDGPYPVDAR